MYFFVHIEIYFSRRLPNVSLLVQGRLQLRLHNDVATREFSEARFRVLVAVKKICSYVLTRSSNPLVSGMATTAVSFHTGSSVFTMVRVLNFSLPSLPSFTVTNGSLLPKRGENLVRKMQGFRLHFKVPDS